MRTVFWHLCAALLLLLAAASPVSAQDPVRDLIRQRTGLNMSAEEIMRRLRESGLSREQLRDRLRQAGFDPLLADRYFDEMSRGEGARTNTGVAGITRPVPPPSGDLVEALSRVGVISTADTLEELRVPSRFRRLSERYVTDSTSVARPAGPVVFGKELFSATTTEFQPILNGPVDPDYRLGPGDRLTLIVTGDVEVAYDLDLTREGYIVIPEVGQVLAAGLTVDGLKKRLNERLGRVYSGIASGATNFDISMGRLRRNLVYIIGEVDIPGAYPVSGGATVFNALYQAGGPNANGSYRAIQVRRNNNVVREVDLYQYLLSGDKSGDVRLEQGDIIFVPVVQRRVTVTGQVKRPAIFELTPQEALNDVLRFAGGVQAEAALERIQIDRILPMGERSPGMERTVVDVSVDRLRSGETVAINDGDRVSIFAITNERRNRITVSGDVHRPGLYEYRAGMNALDLVQIAQGLQSTALTSSAHVKRLNPRDSTTSLVRVSFDDQNASDYAGRVPLQDLDELVVFGRPRLVNPEVVRVFGLVKKEGEFPFSAGMSVQDLVLLAGGFREGALQVEAEVARRNHLGVTGDSLAQVFKVPLSLSMTDAVGPRGDAREFNLVPGDQVFIRRQPGYEPLRTVQVTGEVLYPGQYTIESQADRISRVIRRAGGLTTQAYQQGFQLKRGGKLVGVNLEAALANPGGADDIILRADDELSVPVFDPTVLVTGAVAFESRVRYEPGLSVSDYLSRAGGTLPEADKDRISVRYPNGELRTTRSVLTKNRYPRVEPGSEINVPQEKEGRGVNWDMFLTRTLSIMTATATMLLAINSLK